VPSEQQVQTLISSAAVAAADVTAKHLISLRPSVRSLLADHPDAARRDAICAAFHDRVVDRVAEELRLADEVSKCAGDAAGEVAGLAKPSAGISIFALSALTETMVDALRAADFPREDVVGMGAAAGADGQRTDELVRACAVDQKQLAANQETLFRELGERSAQAEEGQKRSADRLTAIDRELAEIEARARALQSERTTVLQRQQKQASDGVDSKAALAHARDLGGHQTASLEQLSRVLALESAAWDLCNGFRRQLTPAVAAARTRRRKEALASLQATAAALSARVAAWDKAVTVTQEALRTAHQDHEQALEIGAEAVAKRRAADIPAFQADLARLVSQIEAAKKLSVSAFGSSPHVPHCFDCLTVLNPRSGDAWRRDCPHAAAAAAGRG
jgi:hypothetical protein